MQVLGSQTSFSEHFHSDLMQCLWQDSDSRHDKVARHAMCITLSVCSNPIGVYIYEH
jgi:hypothetical protein